MMTRSRILSALAMVLFTSYPAFAAPITSNTSGPFASGGVGFTLGQSVTTPSGGPWDHLTFNLVDTNGNDYAIGGLYLLTQAYSGTPNSLSSATPGFLAKTSTITSGDWVFSSGVTIAANTQYFFYMDTAFNGTEVLFSDSNPYAGGSAYQADTTSSTYFNVSTADLQFALKGTVVNSVSAVPEPASITMLGITAFGSAIFGWRRRKTTTV